MKPAALLAALATSLLSASAVAGPPLPNAAVLIANGPSPENGKKFINYLLTPEVEKALAESEAAQMPLRPGVPVPPSVMRVSDIKAMSVDYAKLATRLEELSKGWLKEWAAQMSAP